MRLKMVTLFVFCFAATFAVAQYNSNGVNGDYQDISSYCTTGTNCWFLLPDPVVVPTGYLQIPCD